MPPASHSSAVSGGPEAVQEHVEQRDLPGLRNAGTTPEDRAHLRYFSYNDLASAEAAADAAGGDMAGIIVTPYRHDIGEDQELADPAFARGLRALCDRTGGALILDDVRCGFSGGQGAPQDG
jgi:glutamate-1-semialdehyde aminotransferase